MKVAPELGPDAAQVLGRLAVAEYPRQVGGILEAAQREQVVPVGVHRLG